MSEQIQQMQRTLLAGTLAGGIAHDMNNQLTVILGHLDIALDHLPDSFDAFDSLEHAKAAASRCADLSRRLLYLSNRRRAVMARMDVVEAVAEAKLMLDCVRPCNTHLKVETEPDLFVLGDTTMIQQAIINLGTNAFYAMKNGGTLEIRAYREEGRVNIIMKDNGSGMTTSLRRRIYEPFFSTHPDDGGSGLGLSMVRTIMNAHGGLIGLDTVPGEGSTFLLNFPPIEEQEEAAL